MMDGLNEPINQPAGGGGTPPVSSQAAPPAPPAPVPPTSYIPPPTTPEPEKEGFGDMLKSMNWVEIGFSALGAATLYFMIFYYNTSSKVNKTYMTEVENKIDDINIKVADIQSAMNREAALPSPLDGGFV